MASRFGPPLTPGASTPPMGPPMGTSMPPLGSPTMPGTPNLPPTMPKKAVAKIAKTTPKKVSKPKLKGMSRGKGKR